MTMTAADLSFGYAAPKVSVLVLCFNHERFLLECLDSIRAQSCADYELIIADDASTDGSQPLIQRWIDANWPGALFVRHDQNAGVCATLAELMRHARGQYISMVATDDVWEPDRLRTLLSAIEAQPQAAVAYSDAAQMDETGKFLPETFMQAHGYRDRKPPAGRIFSALADGNFIPAMATVIRRSAIDAVGGYDPTLSYEDYDMWLKLADQYDFCFVDQLTARYRIVATSMVRTLFERPSAAHSRTVIRIVDHWIDSKRLSENQRRLWALRRLDASYSLFVQNQHDAGHQLWASAVRARKPYWLLLGLVALSGVRRSAMLAARKRLLKLWVR